MERRIYNSLTFNPARWRKYDRINGNIYLGGVPYPLREGSKEDLLKYAKENGVRNILSISDHDLDWKGKGINWLNVKCPDRETTDLYSIFRSTSKFINRAVTRGEKILIHCHAGISRSVSILAAYLILCKNMSTQQSLEYIKSKREVAKPNIGFIKQLLRLEREHRNSPASNRMYFTI